MWSCIWKKIYSNGHVVLVRAFVDDYFPFGDDRETTASFVVEFGMTMTRSGSWETDSG
jgi:hypothetical protein